MVSFRKIVSFSFAILLLLCIIPSASAEISVENVERYWSFQNPVLRIGDIMYSIPEGYVAYYYWPEEVWLYNYFSKSFIILAFDVNNIFKLSSWDWHETNIGNYGKSYLENFHSDYTDIEVVSTSNAHKDEFDFTYSKAKFKYGKNNNMACIGKLFDNSRKQYYIIVTMATNAEEDAQHMILDLFESASRPDLNENVDTPVYNEVLLYAQTLAPKIAYSELLPRSGLTEKVEVDNKIVTVHSDLKYAMDVFYQFFVYYWTDMGFHNTYTEDYLNVASIVLDKTLKLSDGDKAYRDYVEYNMALLLTN